MNSVQSWISIICISAIACTMLEFMAPNGKMEKIVRLVFGAFMIIAIISPVVDTCLNMNINISSRKNVLSSRTNFSDKIYEQSLDIASENIKKSVMDELKVMKVMVTIENGAQTIYATEGKKNTEDTEDSSNGELKRRQKSDDSETKYITVKGPNGEEEALAITEVQPTVKGVVVVCSGGDDPEVQQRIINAVTTALNITTKSVCVTK